jgi:hypothetical protein
MGGKPVNFNDDLRLGLDLVVSMEMTRSTVSHPLWGQVLEGAEIAFHFLIFPSGPSELSHKPYHSEIVLENSGFLSIPILCHFEAESEPRSILGNGRGIVHTILVGNWFLSRQATYFKTP